MPVTILPGKHFAFKTSWCFSDSWQRREFSWLIRFVARLFYGACLRLHTVISIPCFNVLAEKNTWLLFCFFKSSKTNKVWDGARQLGCLQAEASPGTMLCCWFHWLETPTKPSASKGKHTHSPIKGSSEGFRGNHCRPWQNRDGHNLLDELTVKEMKLSSDHNYSLIWIGFR